MSQADPTAANLDYIESLYARYLADRNSVDPSWWPEFDQWKAAANGTADALGQPPAFTPRSVFNPPSNGSAAASPQAQLTGDAALTALQHQVDKMTRNYRVRGHIIADINPIGRRSDDPEELKLDYYGFTDADIARDFATNAVPGQTHATLGEIHQLLRDTYCRKVAVQFMHIDDLSVRKWLQERMEGSRNTATLNRKEQIRVLTRLTDAVIFEQFIQRKFIGAKSFSLEGGESLIPLLDLAFERAGEQGCREIVIGMAHRGRLNVLANIMGKSPQKIFREFEDMDPARFIGGGDVKYHMGYSGDWRTRAGQDIHLSLCFNPSHLEFVNPVALGRMRAKQDRARHAGIARTRGVAGFCVLIHGDSAFAGEGVIQETLNLSELHGYTTGGTLHIIVNNQIGFTTPSKQARSTRYATDVAKMLQAPIIHVNGESPESVAAAVSLAMDFRAQFKRDVFIDMYCYRRRGHNESDEPTYTQPTMYKAIEARPDVRERYLTELKTLGGVSDEDAQRIVERRTELLEKELSAARSEDYVPRTDGGSGAWAKFKGGYDKDTPDVDTGIGVENAKQLLEQIATLPDGFKGHPKLRRFLKARMDMAQGKKNLDWATGEALAFGSLVMDGHLVRLSGQDSQRGTFSQRHAVSHDYDTDEEYRWFRHLKLPDGNDAPGHFTVLNSPLSEIGVLGFEYGYSLDMPEALILWEAQFGDFVNVAQTIIDQFIASAEDKWNRLSSLVMLLPHGFEGMGPEHSSARIERFLNGAAEDNYQVIQPSTPGQYFHALRRQVLRPYRKPLIVFTPKSLLRLPACASTLEALEVGKRFQRVIPDRGDLPAEKVERALLCSGKVYYELFDRRAKLERENIAILRLEQFYPFPEDDLRELLEVFPNLKEVTWVQEEPANMGAWPWLRQQFCSRLLDRYDFNAVTRKASASPATGSRAAHLIEQENILDQAFDPDAEEA